MPDNHAELISILQSIPGMDAGYAIEVVGGSATLYQKIVKQFARLLPSYIDDMDMALRRNDWAVFAVKAHGIKGTLRQLGNINLAKDSEALESAAKEGDTDYCHEHYKAFKDALLCLFTQIDAAFERTGEGKNSAPQGRIEGDISDYLDILERTQSALEDFDSPAAAEILAPLMKIRFGINIDDLLRRTSEALESYQPQKALAYITDIIDNCEKPGK